MMHLLLSEWRKTLKNQISSSSSVGRMRALGAWGRQFESGLFDKVVIDNVHRFQGVFDNLGRQVFKKQFRNESSFYIEIELLPE